MRATLVEEVSCISDNIFNMPRDEFFIFMNSCVDHHLRFVKHQLTASDNLFHPFRGNHLCIEDALLDQRDMSERASDTLMLEERIN
jgi:hypothetical protein